MTKNKRGPAGTFVPAPDSEGRVDANVQVKRTLFNRLDGDLERVDTSGRDGTPTKQRLRRTPIRTTEDALRRSNAFKPNVPRVLNDEGKRNRSRPLPRFHRCVGLDLMKADDRRFVSWSKEDIERHDAAVRLRQAALTEVGSLWRLVEQGSSLSYRYDKVTPTLVHWSGYTDDVPVPDDTFITYAGSRRADMMLVEPDGKEVPVRGTQYVFVVLGRRCTVWDFEMIEPVINDDDVEDAEDDDDPPP